jgi:prepilin peptidase CpaA
MLLLIICVIYILVSAYDISFRTIPDIFPVSIAAIGSGLLLVNGDWVSATTTLGLAVTTYLLLALLCIYGKIGGGDVKLLAASVLLVGAGFFVDFVLLTALAGGVLSLAYLAANLFLKLSAKSSKLAANSSSHKKSKNRLSLLWQIERRRILRSSSVPYGIAISVGSLLTMTLMPM